MPHLRYMPSRHMPHLGLLRMLLRRMKTLLECACACCDHESNIVLARYKSNKAKIAKSSLGNHALEFHKFPLDLMPLDYGLWNKVERRMSKHKIKGHESVEAFKKRLRRTARYPCITD